MCFYFLFSISNTFSFTIFISWFYLFIHVDSISFFFMLPTHFMEKGLATHSSILAWRIPWTEEPGRLQVHRVAKSRIRLKRLSMHKRTHFEAAVISFFIAIKVLLNSIIEFKFHNILYILHLTHFVSSKETSCQQMGGHCPLSVLCHWLHGTIRRVHYTSS